MLKIKDQYGNLPDVICYKWLKICVECEKVFALTKEMKWISLNPHRTSFRN